MSQDNVYTRITLQKAAELDTGTPLSAGQYPKFVVNLSKSIQGVTSEELGEAVTRTEAAASKAATSEKNAKTSETAAKNSQTAAATSQSEAKKSQDAAKTSENNAKSSETAAKSSQTAAASSQAAAKTSETNAKTSENAAKASQTAAASSQTAAKTSETNAKASENAAKNSQTATASSQSAAKASETAAAASQVAAKKSEDAAKKSEDAAKASEIANANALTNYLPLAGGRMSGTIIENDLSAATYASERLTTNRDSEATLRLRRFRYLYNSTIFHEVVDSQGLKVYTGTDLDRLLYWVNGAGTIAANGGFVSKSGSILVSEPDSANSNAGIRLEIVSGIPRIRGIRKGGTDIVNALPDSGGMLATKDWAWDNFPRFRLAIPDTTDLFVYFLTARSGFYSSGANIVNGVPASSKTSDYIWQSHSETTSGVIPEGGNAHGVLTANTLSGQTYIAVLSNGKWRGWVKLINSDTLLESATENKLFSPDNNGYMFLNNNREFGYYDNANRKVIFKVNRDRAEFYSDNNKGIVIGNMVQGNGNSALFTTVKGGSWADWRVRPAALDVKASDNNGSSSIWKLRSNTGAEIAALGGYSSDSSLSGTRLQMRWNSNYIEYAGDNVLVSTNLRSLGQFQAERGIFHTTESWKLAVVTSEDNSNYIGFFNNGSVATKDRAAYIGFGDKNLNTFTIRNDKTNTQFIIGDKVATLNGTRVLVWGDYGIGGTGMLPQNTNVNSYISTSDQNAARQQGMPGIGAGIQTTYAGNRRAQMWVDTGSKFFWRFSLKSGTDTDTGWKQGVAVGDWGIGHQQGPAPSNSDFNLAVNSGFYGGPGGVANPLNVPPQTSQGNPLYGAFLVASRSSTEAFQLGCHSNEIWFRPKRSGTWQDYQRFYTTANTVTDANGNLKAASPVIRVYKDHIEPNEEAEGVTVEKLSTGVYKLKGVLGMNSDPSWGGIHGGLVVPNGINNLPLVWADFEVLPDGDMIIETRYRKHSDLPPPYLRKRLEVYPEFTDENGNELESYALCDIPNGHWVDVRVQMPEDSIYNQAVAKAEADSIAADKAREREEVLQNLVIDQNKWLTNTTREINK